MPDDEHRAGSMPDHVVGGAAEQDLVECSVPVRSDDDRLTVAFAGQGDQRLGHRFAGVRERERLGVEPALLREPGALLGQPLGGLLALVLQLKRDVQVGLGGVENEAHRGYPGVERDSGLPDDCDQSRSRREDGGRLAQRVLGRR